MDRHEFIEFLISLNLKGISKDPKDEEVFFDLFEKGIEEAFKGFTKDEKLFIASFLTKYPHIFYVELIRRVYGVEIWKKVKNYYGDIKKINWEYHKYFYHQYVGPFFYINGQIKALKMDYTDGNFTDEFINHPTSHFDYFNLYNLDSTLDYGNFPRGRVIFNNETNEFYLYIDKELLDKKEIINGIKKLYNLTSSNVLILKDEHYTHDELR